MIPVIKRCDNCGIEFEVKHKDRLVNRTHLFCSKKCEGEFRRKETFKKNSVVCPICGNRFYIKPYMLRKAKHEPCCSYECLAQYRKQVYLGSNNPNFGNKGSKNPIWKSDKKISSYGYVLIRIENHPFRNSDGFVFEHRLIAEQYLLTDENSIEINGKRYLSPDFVVHHKDGNRQNNDINNPNIMALIEYA